MPHRSASVFAALLIACAATPTAAQRLKEPPVRLRAPELPQGFAWINTDRPLSFAGELKGRVVLLDFWTFCCINCQHVLPDLAWLEAKYRDRPFTVIGVHSAKFDHEQDPAAVRAAVRRHDVDHPVLVDRGRAVWSSYAVRAWPTFCVVDPEGYVVGSISGEGRRDVLDRTVAALLELHAAKGTLAAAPLALRRDAEVRGASGLRFPGKVRTTADRMYVADSGHHRVVETTFPDADGRVRTLRVFGDGVRGLRDGPPSTARFAGPQGLCVDGGSLIVADVENHAVRAIDLASGATTVLAGTGVQGRDRRGGRPALEQNLASPWDVARADGALYVAMAGLHQIWRLDRRTGTIAAWAGSGREDLVDGPAGRAALAQPSGLAAGDGALFVVDSETSAIRRADLA
ncbi:MAG TPA: thioredoxin-like domain-containing protein, partial [Planctomycetota bacterium]|nr:thioredoxin-like domain-containing protein [Planctomycetota bacterium]